MKNKITLKEFFDSEEKLVIHCDTEEKANKLLKEFDELGKKWNNRESYLQRNNFDEHNDRTCYSNEGAFCEIKYYKDKNYKIYSFEDIIFEENNLIPEIAKMLGVEIGEEFILRGQGRTKHKLDLEKGLMFCDEDLGIWFRASKGLSDLLSNANTIEKLPKKLQLTDAERVILENLPKEYKWIARDKYGELTVFESKPFKEEGVIFWRWHDGYTLSLKAFKHLFQFIKWEDSEAYNIEELLKGE